MEPAGSELIDRLIAKHKEEGRPLEELSGTRYIYGGAIYQLGKLTKRGTFNLTIDYVKDLEEEFLAGRI